MQKIGDIFEHDVTREIPPVVYFHEIDPEYLEGEVDEYIITGGYNPDDRRHLRVERGIHEEYVRLLKGFIKELEDPSGKEPASWISGFYGSGKSSFAKMLGVALDGAKLPDGRDFAEAWLSRNKTPRREEFINLWNRLNELIDPVAVIFDIGGAAREEPIHVTILRETLKRFGYATDHRVAYWELELERNSYYDAFMAAYEKLYEESWSEGLKRSVSVQRVSATMYEIQPQTYESKGDWVKRYAREDAFNLGPNEVRDAIKDVLDRRAPDKTLFLVIDEVSQYVIGHPNRMLQLQSFNSALSHMRGRAWLLATGQQRLEEEGMSTELGRFKDRFPKALRVHLGEQNIREVVHRRLLQKSTAGDTKLRELYRQNDQNLKLYAYDCQEITEEDFVEVYPLLPGHINLLLDITTEMRHRSTRMQGDSHSVRGLMQLLAELFKEQKLAERPVGSLVSFDDIYDVQETSLEADVQRTMDKIRSWTVSHSEPFAFRVAKVIALLQLVQSAERPTTLDFISQCLYDQLDRGATLKDDVKVALEKLKNAQPTPLISYSETDGYRLESSARAEWNKEKSEFSISSQDLASLVQDRLKNLIETPQNPRLQGVPIPYDVIYTDSRGNHEVSLKGSRGKAHAPIDLRLLTDRNVSEWIPRSGESQFRDRLIWLAGKVSPVFDAARDLGKSTRMIRRYDSQPAQSLTTDKQLLLVQEKSEAERLERALTQKLEAVFLDGTFFFRGRSIDATECGEGFGTALETMTAEVLDALYPHFSPLQVSNSEIEQLVKPSLAGASNVFKTGDGLGIIGTESGQLACTCEGRIPGQILEGIQTEPGVAGARLFEMFTGIPYGYSGSVIRASLLGLLRGHFIEIDTVDGTRIESYGDLGTQDLFSSEAALKKANFREGKLDTLGMPEKVQIAKLFEGEFQINVGRDEGELAKAAFDKLPGRRKQVQQLRSRLQKIQHPMPEHIVGLEDAINLITSTKDDRKVVGLLWQNIDRLREGFETLNRVRQNLDEDHLEAIKAARSALQNQMRQLSEIDAVDERVQEAERALEETLSHETPWRHIDECEAHVSTILEAYAEQRRRELELTFEAVESAHNEVKLRDGFDKLNSDESHSVLRPIGRLYIESDVHELTPALTAIQLVRGSRLRAAIDDANATLDQMLEVVVPMRHGLNGRIIRNHEELDAALETLRKTVSEQLSRGKEVRLQN